MRLWSLHPKFLDAKGLVALWRETLLAKKVLAGQTRGYRHHPQLQRFRSQARPVDSVDVYLQEIFHEAARRNYSFDRGKVNWAARSATIPVTTGQLRYETEHLMLKLKTRDREQYKANSRFEALPAHPLFTLIDGQVENWEKTGP